MLTGVWLLVLLSSAERDQLDRQTQLRAGDLHPSGDVTGRQPGCGATRVRWGQSSLSSGAAARSGLAALTDSELAVVDLVVQGLINREVAARLFVLQHTVRKHLRHVFEKLELNCRVELASGAARHGSPAL